MHSEFIGNKEYMIDESMDNIRIYIVDGWQIEKYNGKEHKMPNLSKELTKEEFNHQKYNYYRNKKLSRILKFR